MWKLPQNTHEYCGNMLGRGYQAKQIPRGRLVETVERKMFHDLESWKRSTRRKPLLLMGARQVGKTYALNWLKKKEFNNGLYVNFEEHPEAKGFFDGKLDPHSLIENLSILFHQKVDPGRTLVVFDEIQECPRALTALKYFYEKAPSYHIAAAGSLLGVKMSKASSFPVGKVDFLNMHPLTFLEFIQAVGERDLARTLESVVDFSPLPTPFHEHLNRLLKSYFFVGGMPEAVLHFIEKRDFEETRKIQKDILTAYQLDISKHAAPHDIQKIFRIWDSIPAQLAKDNRRFIFSALAHSARAREYESALQWLIDAGLVIKVENLSAARVPLSSYANRTQFKLFVFDVGLLGAMARLSSETVVLGEGIFTEFKGTFVENFVAQELSSRSAIKPYYWTSGNQAEVDFVVEDKGSVFPLEAKAGVNLKAKSLHAFEERFKPPALSRTSLRNFSQRGSLYDFPLYGIQHFPVLAQKVTTPRPSTHPSKLS